MEKYLILAKQPAMPFQNLKVESNLNYVVEKQLLIMAMVR